MKKLKVTPKRAFDNRKFIQVPIEVLSGIADGHLKFNHVKVLLAMYAHYNPKTEDPVFPKRSTITKMTGLRETRVSDITDELQELGWCVKEKNSGGRSRPAHYHMLSSSLLAAVRERQKTVPDSGTVSEKETVPVSGQNSTSFRYSHITNHEHKGAVKARGLWGRSPMAAGEAAWMEGA